VRGSAWWRHADTYDAYEMQQQADKVARAEAEAAKATARAKAKAEAAAKAEADAAEAAAQAEAEAAESMAAEPEVAAEERDEGPCPCFKCDDTVCAHPDCETCGTKASSGCDQQNAWGCYTTAEAECTCNARKAPIADAEAPYNDEEPYRPDEPFEDEDEVETFKDYNQEYYHGEAKDGDQDEGQPQTCEQFMLGPHILVQPITAMTVTTSRVYLPAEDPVASAIWYDLHTAAKLISTPTARVVTVDVHADRVPSFLRGGAVLPRRMRPRRSSSGTHTDPFTLIVAPDAEGRATGNLFLDSYDGYDGLGLSAIFALEGGSLLSGSVHEVSANGAPKSAKSIVERVIVYGQTVLRKAVVRGAEGGVVEGVETSFDAATGSLTIRQPKVSVGEAWTIELVAA